MQSDDLGLVERLRRGPVAYTSAGGPVYNGADPLMDEAAAAIERLVADRDEARELAERLKLEAQGHAMEARTANSTNYEIYQVVSGAKGERGNWHGATPVRERFAALTEALTPFAAEKLPSSKATEIAYNEFGLRCLMSPLAIARQRARQALKDAP